MKKTKIQFLATTLALLLTVTACAPKTQAPAETTDATQATESTQGTPSEAAPASDSETSLAKPRLQDDFYTAINYEWLESAQIPDDQVMISPMSQLSIDVDKNLRADLDEALKNGENNGDTPKNQMLKFYQLATDFNTIDEAGVEPILPYLQQIDNVKTIDELNKAMTEWIVQTTPFGIGPMADMKDATKKALYIQPAENILPDKTYYAEDNAAGQQMLALYKENSLEMLKKIGESDEVAERRITNTLAIDKRLAEHALSAEEASDFTKMYNPVSRADMEKDYKGALDIMSIVDAYIPSKVNEVVLTNTDSIQNLDEIFGLQDGDMQALKDWMYVLTLRSNADFLSQDIREISAKYSNAIMGTTPTADERNKAAYATTDSLFSSVIGDMYAQKYFSKEAKDDVTKMTSEFIDVYRKHLETNDWLSDETKKEAIKKLDNMVINVGYPEELPKYVPLLKVDESKSFFENYYDLLQVMVNYQFDTINEPVDRSEFVIAPQVVNAMYSPLSNSINFPAAILQGVMYSPDNTPSENYGAIGTVIAHEISHAFDTNGSKYDENGSLKNWWTEEDYKAFEERTQKVIDAFDGLPLMDGQVNGALTVSENVADLGGLSVSLEAAKANPSFSAEEFFSQYGFIWATNMRPEVADIILTTDVHAPAKWRVNAQVVNFDDFYTAFDVKEGDGMWKAPADRLHIW